MGSVERLQEAWREDRAARDAELALCVAEAERYRGALRRIARSDPGSYFGLIAASALQMPDVDLADVSEWGSSGVGT